MNILVTGGTGQLGHEIKEASISSRDDYCFVDIDTLDVSNLTALDAFFSKNPIQVIVNCAAYTNVDRAESEPDLANKVNHLAVVNLTKIAIKYNVVLIHISTDYVFGGNKNTPYTESDLINPLGVYGRTKYLGEKSIINSGCLYLIIRTSWLYSWQGNNFLQTMLNLTATKKEIQVVFDQVGTPTNAKDLASFIVEILSTREYINKQDVFHFSNEGVCSWYDFAYAINELAGHNCLVRPCYSSQFLSPVKRPSYSVLDKTKIKKTFNFNIPYWRDSLNLCISKIINHEKI